MGLMEPEFLKQEYGYYDGENHLCIKEDAPQWAKDEFEDFMKKVNPEPNEDGLIIQY